MTKKTIIAASAAFFVTFGVRADGSSSSVEDPTDSVLTEMGTSNEVNSDHKGCSISCGNLYPATMRPWGFGAFSPQTAPGRSVDKDHDVRWFYNYTDTKIYGIRHTHQPSPWMGDYGAWSFMPLTGGLKSESERGSSYSHDTETFKPYCYGVRLSDYNITAEIAPSVHGAIAQFTYNDTTETPELAVDPQDGGEVTLSSDGMSITGYSVRNDQPDGSANLKMYFVLRFESPVDYVGTSDGALFVSFPNVSSGGKVSVRSKGTLMPSRRRSSLRATTASPMRAHPILS